MPRISPLLLKYLQKLIPQLYAVIQFFVDFIRMISHPLRSQTAADELSAEFVKRILTNAETLIKSKPRGKPKGMLRSISLFWTIWTLYIFVIIGIFLAHRIGAGLGQEELRRLIHITEKIPEYQELRRRRASTRRFRLGWLDFCKRYRKIRQARDLAQLATSHIVLGAAHTQLDIGDLHQTLGTAVAHFQIASDLLAQVDLEGLKILSGAVFAAIGATYFSYPAENHAKYARQAIEELGKARDILAKHTAPALEAARQRRWKEISLRKASPTQIARFLLRHASASVRARWSEKPVDPVLTIFFMPAFVAWLDWKIGGAHQEYGEQDMAIAKFESALETLALFGEYAQKPDPLFQNICATILVSKGTAYLERKSGLHGENIDKAIACFSEGSKIVKQLPAENWVLKTYALSLIGDAKCYFQLEKMGRINSKKLGELRSMLTQQLRTAARLGRKAGALLIAEEALVLLGKAFLLQADKARAWRSFVVASRLIDRMQRRSRSYRLSRYWVSIAANLYEFLVRTAFEYDPPSSTERTVSSSRVVLFSALSHFERGRTLFLQRELANRDPLPKGASPHDSAVQKFLRLRREWLAADLRSFEREMAPAFPLLARVRGVRDPLSAIESRYLREIDELRQEYADPDYDPDRLAPPIGSRDLYKLIGRLSSTIETAIIEYFISDCYLVIAVFLPGVLTLRRSGIGRTELEDIEARWLIGYKKATSGKISSHHWEQGYLRQVLGRLRRAIEPAVERIAKWETETQRRIKRIIVIPHRFLHLIPLHVVELADGRFWGDSVRVQYAPSASVLLRLMDLRAARRKQSEEPLRKVVAVAYAPAKHPLIFHEEEARAVAEVSGGGDVITGHEATRERVKEAIRDAAYIHFACHGTFDAEDPFNGGLFLTPNASGESHPHYSFSPSVPGVDVADAQDDGGFMKLGEIFQEVRLSRARLVVLSACETGVTKVERSHEEYIGLPAGFLYAGASTVVSSLWRVSDVATWLLMREFAREIAAGADAALALRCAQHKLRSFSRDSVIQEINRAASKEADPVRSEQMIDASHSLPQEDLPFTSPYWWAGFTVNGLG